MAYKIVNEEVEIRKEVNAILEQIEMVSTQTIQTIIDKLRQEYKTEATPEEVANTLNEIVINPDCGFKIWFIERPIGNVFTEIFFNDCFDMMARQPEKITRYITVVVKA